MEDHLKWRGTAENSFKNWWAANSDSGDMGSLMQPVGTDRNFIVPGIRFLIESVDWQRDDSVKECRAEVTMPGITSLTVS